MTNYNLKNKSELPVKEMPVRKIDEKRKKRLALLTRIELQRIRTYKNLIKNQ